MSLQPGEPDIEKVIASGTKKARLDEIYKQCSIYVAI